jgi:flagellar basal-body rod modification protein FlgD
MHILSTHAVTSPQSSATAPASNAGSNAPVNSPDQLTKESTFLSLLVAQIKNQDPLNPTDSIQFIGQLVQFSQLEQLLGINQGIQGLLSGGQKSTSGATPLPTRSGN